MTGQMKKLLSLALLAFSTLAHAEPLQNCLTLMDATNQNASTTGTITEFVTRNVSSMSIVATANNVSGTTPTLDIAIDSCRLKSGTCKSWNTITQCTTGSCWTDGFLPIDINNVEVNWFKFFRVRTTLGGTSPVYNVKVELCYTS